MAYAEDFYIPENIIGYTGVLNKNPTVYFLSATHYGHITQVHKNWDNVGREEIRSAKEYKFGNVGDNNRLYERDYLANLAHPSRSPMMLVRAGAIPPELTHAIMVHPEKKAHRPRQSPEVGDANLARRAHPGQQPDDDERSNAAGGGIKFLWDKGVGTGVAPDTVLAKLCR